MFSFTFFFFSFPLREKKYRTEGKKKKTYEATHKPLLTPLLLVLLLAQP
jgi:hypothetical protein